MNTRLTAFLPALVVAVVICGLPQDTTADVISPGVVSRNDPTIVIPSTGFVTGDGNLTFDPQTNLEWLDATVSLRLSFNHIVGGGTPSAVAAFQGFRYATVAEVFAFFNHAGVVAPNDGVEDSLAQAALQSLWGVTSQLNNELFSFAITSDPDPEFSDLLNVAFLHNKLTRVDLTGPGPRGSYGLAHFVTDSRMGSALVRVAIVPEPSTFALAALGALGFLVAARRK